MLLSTEASIVVADVLYALLALLWSL